MEYFIFWKVFHDSQFQQSYNTVLFCAPGRLSPIFPLKLFISHHTTDTAGFHGPQQQILIQK